MLSSNALILTLTLIAAAGPAAPPPKAAPTPEEARLFVSRLNDELKKLSVRVATAEWIKVTYITDDTERNAAQLNEELMAYMTRAIQESRRFDGLNLDFET